MTYIVLTLSGFILLLIGALAIAVKTARTRGHRVKGLEAELESARNDLRRQGEYQKLKEEAQHNADTKKETLHTGDSTTDFNNSLDLLHGAGKNRGS